MNVPVPENFQKSSSSMIAETETTHKGHGRIRWEGRRKGRENTHKEENSRKKKKLMTWKRKTKFRIKNYEKRDEA